MGTERIGGNRLSLPLPSTATHGEGIEGLDKTSGAPTGRARASTIAPRSTLPPLIEQDKDLETKSVSTVKTEIEENDKRAQQEDVQPRKQGFFARFFKEHGAHVLAVGMIVLASVATGGLVGLAAGAYAATAYIGSAVLANSLTKMAEAGEARESASGRPIDEQRLKALEDELKKLRKENQELVNTLARVTTSSRAEKSERAEDQSARISDEELVHQMRMQDERSRFEHRAGSFAPASADSAKHHDDQQRMLEIQQRLPAQASDNHQAQVVQDDRALEDELNEALLDDRSTDWIPTQADMASAANPKATNSTSAKAPTSLDDSLASLEPQLKELDDEIVGDFKFPFENEAQVSSEPRVNNLSSDPGSPEELDPDLSKPDLASGAPVDREVDADNEHPLDDTSRIAAQPRRGAIKQLAEKPPQAGSGFGEFEKELFSEQPPDAQPSKAQARMRVQLDRGPSVLANRDVQKDVEQRVNKLYHDVRAARKELDQARTSIENSILARMQQDPGGENAELELAELDLINIERQDEQLKQRELKLNAFIARYGVIAKLRPGEE